MCLTCLLNLKTDWYFTKWDGLIILFVIQYIQCFRIFETLQMFFYKFLLKRGKNEENFQSSIFFEAQKYYFVFESRLIFFSNCHIRNVVLTLPNVVKIDIENHNVV